MPLKFFGKVTRQGVYRGAPQAMIHPMGMNHHKLII